MVDLFIQGGYFMYPLLLMFFFGVVVAFERYWTLSKAHINAKEFMVELQDALPIGRDRFYKRLGLR